MDKQDTTLKQTKRVVRDSDIAWDKLDNTANLFPVIATEDMSNVYRISAVLKEEVDRVCLQEALNMVLPNLPIFRMRLKAGMFWYYFEDNNRPAPLVTEESSYPGAYINKSKNQHYMFRVTHYKNRINLEVFHALTDGFGGVIFLKELVYQYLRLAHPDELAGEKNRISTGIFLDTEDSYLRNFKKTSKHPKGYKSKKAITVTGERLGKNEMGVVHGYMPISELKVAAKKYGATINQYLVATFVYAVYKEYLRGNVSEDPISCCVPVNLRPYYDSHTMKNFFVMVSAEFKPEKDSYAYEEVIKIVIDSLKEQITPENLANILYYNVSNETNFILRLVPLVIKNLAIKQVYGASAHANTATITNIGSLDLREPYNKYVDRFYAMLSMSKGQNIKGACCSCNGIMTFTFSSCLASLAIQKKFFQLIAKEGVNVAIETNDVYYE
ncbi:MAG: hypothetical protein II699_07130 [Lachnospiraceae bacterium]|nr:hypothetical protein [Lachnospiraceae bacterium]